MYSDELADTICELIAEGKSLVSICKRPDMPGYATVMRWVKEREGFRESYQRAREDQADFLAEEMLDIADDASLDIGFTDDGKPFVRGENIQRAKLKVDSRKWLAGKLKPKKYGERIQQDVEVGVKGTLAELLAEIDGQTRCLVSNGDGH